MFTVCWTQFLFFVGVGSRLFLITCPKAVLRSLDVHEFRCLWLNTVQLVHGFSVFLYTQLKVQKTPRRIFWHLNVQHPMLGGKTHSRPLSVIICGISFCPAVVLVLENHNRAVLICASFPDTRVKGSVLSGTRDTEDELSVWISIGQLTSMGILHIYHILWWYSLT